MAGSKQKYNALLSAVEDEDLPSFTLNDNSRSNSPTGNPLQFQNFPSSSQPLSGKILQPNPPTPSIPSTSSSSPLPPSSNKQPPQHPLPTYRDPANAKIWHVEYYSKYFDVDTNDVLHRIRLSLYPNSTFLSTLALHKDLYGPFWVPTTLIFSLFVSSSLANSVVTYLNNTNYTPDITRLATAASVVYIYSAVLPLFVWAIGKYLAKPMQMVQIMGIFGYSQVLWIPLTFLCIIPLELVRWVLVGFIFVVTGAFITRNLHSLLTTASPDSPVPVQGTPLKVVLMGTFCAHIVFALLLKFLFFSYTLVSSTSSNPN